MSLAGGSTSNSPMPRSRHGWRVQTPHVRAYDRGYGRLFLDHVTQADEGCDFDFLQPPAASTSAHESE